MRSARLCLIALLLPIWACSAKSPDYSVYHILIIKAETQMFVKGNYDSAKYYFDKAFAGFDYCFLRDCIVAAQLAILHKDTTSCFRYINKGFENGLRPKDLLSLTYDRGINSRVRLFDTLLDNPDIFKRLTYGCDSLRPGYLSRINKGVRKLINEAYIYDQIARAYFDPRYMAVQPHFQYPEDKFANLFDSLIRNVGYPGEKIIGIDEEGLATALGIPEAEPLTIFQRHRSTDSSIAFITVDKIHIYRDLLAHSSFIPFVRNSCSYLRFQPFMVAQIKAGNIHPRDVAGLLKKVHYQYAKSKCRYDEELIPYFFSSASDSTYKKFQPASDKKRVHIYLMTHEVELAALAYEKQYHMQFCLPH